ncbi:MAG: hypothetical protein ACREOC_03175 [Gemmatimonadales bacterium]
MPRAPGWLRCTFASALVLPTLATAQESASPFIYATYFQCDPSREARADALMREALAPIFDQRLADKRLTAWGWLAHSLGGQWRRVSYLIAPSRDALLDAQSGVAADMRARHAKAWTEFTSICSSHDDYIWRGVASSQPSGGIGQSRPPAAYSIYYECAMGRQSRADTLTMQAFAPIYARHVKAGGLNSWAWYEHSTGGKYRRLLVFDGASHKAILASSDSIIADIARERPAEGKEFNEICHSHQDYLWDIQTAKP